MAILGDYHTHTTLSHGKGTIEQNVVAAIKAGLNEIAITDHGFGHIAYATNRTAFAKAREEVKTLQKKYPDLKILLGLETNLISRQGHIDLKEGESELLDIVVCGFHKFAKPKSVAEAFGFFVPNLIGVGTKKVITANTDAYIKLIEKHKIDIISHINYAIKADVLEVARACRHYGTYVELNGKRISFTDEEIEKMTAEGQEFIVNSDAHSAARVGDMSLPVGYIERLGIPYLQIANWDKLPKFRSRKL